MYTGQRIQKKNRTQSSSSATEADLFRHRPLSNETEPTSADLENQETPDLQAQSERAARFGHNFGRVKVQDSTAGDIQFKLAIGAPGDKYEQEADSVAAQVMSMNTPASQSSLQRQGMAPEEEEVQMKPLASTITPLVQRQEAAPEEEPLQTKPLIQREDNLEEEDIQTKPLIQREDNLEEEDIQTKPLVQREASPEEEELQTKPLVQREASPEEEELQTKPLVQREASPEEEELQTKRSPQKSAASSDRASDNLENQLTNSKGGGSPLPDDVRSFMEPRFGVDFSQVRVHTNSQAVQMNQAVGAQAFTHGSDIYFGAGKSPGISDLTAHELTHVVQQTGGVQTKLREPIQTKLATSSPQDATEREANAVADSVIRGESVQVSQPATAELHGNWLTDAASAVGNWIGDATDSRPDEARLDAQEELAGFMKQEYDATNHHPTTGRGLFDAKYIPASGSMAVTLKLCFKFVSGDPTDPSWIAAVGGPAAAATYTPEQFAWQDGETDAWKASAISDVEAAWSQQYKFHITRKYWEALPDVNVQINIVEAPADEAHYVTTIRKWPKDGGPLDGVVPPGAANQSTAQFEESTDNGISQPDVDHYSTSTASNAAYQIVDTTNPGQIFFAQGSSKIEAADQTKLKNFGSVLQRPEIPPFSLTVTGHSSAEGSEQTNMTLSEDRAREVSNEIVSAGAKTQPKLQAEGEKGADETPQWRRVDITVGSFDSSQETVLHEFGHMFGLGDEYPGSSRAVGTKVAHSNLAETLIPGQQPILATENDSIMSVGQTIKPHHYVTFLEALGTMTGTTGEWNVGPGSGSATKGLGDFPARGANEPIPV